MKMLDRPDLENVIRWQPHGRAFLVSDTKQFTKDILPRFFKQSKWTSFTRQLNLWNFQRITQGPDTGAYVSIIFGIFCNPTQSLAHHSISLVPRALLERTV